MAITDIAEDELYKQGKKIRCLEKLLSTQQFKSGATGIKCMFISYLRY